MRKLGKRQLQILQVMATENVEFGKPTTDVYTILGRTNSVFFSGHIGEEINRIVTFERLFALQKRGLVENVTEEGWRWRGSRYRITEAGLAIVKEEN